MRLRNPAASSSLDLPLLPGLSGVVRQVKKMETDVKSLKDNPQTTLLEGLHSVAYHGGLSRPLICPEGCLSGLTADVVADFYAQNYTAPRIVVAAGGWAAPQGRVLGLQLEQRESTRRLEELV